MDTVQDKIHELDNLLGNIRDFRKVAFQPMPPAPGAMPPGGAPPMDPAMMQGQPPMDPAMMQGQPPMDPAAMAQGGGQPMPQAPTMPPELEQALADMMSALEQVMMVIEQQKQTVSQVQQQVQEVMQKSMEMDAQLKMLDKAVSSQAAYEPPMPAGPGDPAAGGGGEMMPPMM